MVRGEQSDRVSSVALELGTGTVVIDGDRVELPPKEFKLFSELAARPGEALSVEELTARVWPEIPGMTSQDLYWHVWRLRKLIGDDKRDRKILGNRRGFGYLIDLEPDAVDLVVDVSQARAADDVPSVPEPEAGVQDFDERPVPLAPPDSDPRGSDLARRTRPRPLWLRAGAFVAALTAAWAAGLILARFASGPERERNPVAQAEGPRTSESQLRRRDPDRTRRRPRAEGGTKKKPPRRHETGVAAPPASTSVGTLAPRSTGHASSRSGSRENQSRAKKELAPDYPPAPTAHLYHLYNPNSGDHFVTTDGDVASEYQGRGFTGGAIGRVYTTAEQNTKAIGTNHGPAYIFVDSSPRTDPASETLALYYVADNKGDFFYTTRRSEADQEGWSASVIGYVRTPR